MMPHAVAARRVLCALGLVLALTLPAAATDFADGLAGGPDAWVVSGLRPGAHLAVRATPSVKGDQVARVTEGARLMNKGCVIRASQRWCRIAPVETGTPSGWVPGRFLREAP